MTHLTNAGLSSLAASSGRWWGLCSCSLELWRLAAEDIAEDQVVGAPEGVDLGGRGVRGWPFREHLLIPQVFPSPCSVLALGWVMLPPDSDHDSPGFAS